MVNKTKPKCIKTEIYREPFHLTTQIVFGAKVRKPNKKCVNEFAKPLLDKGVEMARNNLKTICFSEDPLSPVMWSRYAGYHSGIVVAYEKKALENAYSYTAENKMIKGQKLRLEKITYSNEFIDLGAFFYHYLPTRNDLNAAHKAVREGWYDLPQENLYKALFTKMPEWAYEKEWRIIPDKTDLLSEDE